MTSCGLKACFMKFLPNILSIRDSLKIITKRITYFDEKSIPLSLSQRKYFADKTELSVHITYV